MLYSYLLGFHEKKNWRPYEQPWGVALKEGVGGAANELIILSLALSDLIELPSWQRIWATKMSIGGSSGEWGLGACLAGMCKTCRRNVVALINIRDNNGRPTGRRRVICRLPHRTHKIKSLNPHQGGCVSLGFLNSFSVASHVFRQVAQAESLGR